MYHKNIMSYNFRNATLKDLDFILHLIETSFKNCIVKTWGSWNIQEQRNIWEEKLHSEKTFEIIEENGKDIWLFYKNISEKNIDIEWLFLLPEFQGKWIGGHIINQLIQKSIKESKSLSLQSLKSNIKAIEFYKKIGFVIVNEDDKRYYFMYERKI